MDVLRKDASFFLCNFFPAYEEANNKSAIQEMRCVLQPVAELKWQGVI